MALMVKYERKVMQVGEWVDVCYGNGIYLAVARDCTAAWSDNNNTWHQIGVFSKDLKIVNPHLAFGNGRFVLAAYNAKNRKLVVAFTKDGILWNLGDLGGDHYLGQYLCIGYGMFRNFNEKVNDFVCEDTFYILGKGIYGLKSTDGHRWTKFIISLDPETECIATCRGGEDNSTFVALSPATDTFLVSTKGVGWESVKAPHITDAHKWISVAYNNGKFIAMTADGRLSHSKDGKTWDKAETICVYGDQTIWPLVVHIVQDPINVKCIFRVCDYFVIIAERTLYNFSYLTSKDGKFWFEYEFGDYIDNASICCTELGDEGKGFGRKGFMLLNSYKWLNCLFDCNYFTGYVSEDECIG